MLIKIRTQDKKVMDNWRKDLLEFMNELLGNCEREEDWENCIRFRDNIIYLKSFSGAPNQTIFPYPYEILEEDEMIYFRFIPLPKPEEDAIARFPRLKKRATKRKLKRKDNGD